MKAPATYTVLYWSGGHAVGRWNQVLGSFGSEGAHGVAREIRRGGRVAYVFNEAALAAIGWPEGPPPELLKAAA